MQIFAFKCRFREICYRGIFDNDKAGERGMCERGICFISNLVDAD